MSNFKLYTVPFDLKKGELVVISDSGEIMQVGYPQKDLHSIGHLDNTIHSKPLRIEEPTKRLVINRRPTYKFQIDQENIVRYISSHSPARSSDIYRALLGANPDRVAAQFLRDDLASLLRKLKITKTSDGVYQIA